MDGLLEELASVGLEHVRRRAYEEGIKHAINIVAKHPDRALELLKLTLRDAMTIGDAAHLSAEERSAVINATWFNGRIM